jgi:RNA polymerase sigma factor (sigma-70 family)
MGEVLRKKSTWCHAVLALTCHGVLVLSPAMDESRQLAGVAAVSNNGEPGGFASTAWSLVLAAADGPVGCSALDRLCRRYWRPVYICVRRGGVPRPDAEDATQDFFVYLLTREWIKQADPQRGSFRAFLLTLLRNFLSNRRRHVGALKRGGAQEMLPLDPDVCERELESMAAGELSPAQAYERSWANCVVDAALDRLAAEKRKDGNATQFDQLRPFLTEPPGPGDYERLSVSLGLPRARVAVVIHRYSRRFAELIRSEVAETLVDRTALEIELRGLLEAMAR